MASAESGTQQHHGRDPARKVAHGTGEGGVASGMAGVVVVRSEIVMESEIAMHRWGLAATAEIAGRRNAAAITAGLRLRNRRWSGNRRK